MKQFFCIQLKNIRQTRTYNCLSPDFASSFFYFSLPTSLELIFIFLFATYAIHPLNWLLIRNLFVLLHVFNKSLNVVHEILSICTVDIIFNSIKTLSVSNIYLNLIFKANFVSSLIQFFTTISKISSICAQKHNLDDKFKRKTWFWIEPSYSSFDVISSACFDAKIK